MGQRYDGTLVIQTKDSTSPTGNYVLSVLSDQAEEKDIINNKQGYNGTGNIITGTNKKGYAGQVFSETEMDSYLTEENVGRILQYLGQAEGSEGGTPVPVNPIAVGDILESTAEGDEGHPILYLNTTITPDFSQFPEEQMLDGEHGGYPLISLDENGGSTPFITALKAVNGSGEGGAEVYGIMAGGKVLLYAFSPNMEPSGMELETWGWQVTTPVTIDGWGGVAKVTAVNQQDIWGAYISKDGQWTSGGGGGTPASVPFGSSGDGVGTVADATGVYLNPDLNATAIKTALANSNNADAAVAYLRNADSETMFMLYIKNDNDVLIICKMDEASDTYVPFYAEQAGTYKNTAFAGGFENIPTDGNVAGFIPLAFYTPSEEIATIFDLFVSKTPFSGGGSAYTTGAIYQVVDDGAAIVFKEIRI